MSSLAVIGVQGRFITVPTGLFIYNEFVPSLTGQTISVETPATGQQLGIISAAGAADINRAVESAKLGFQAWRTVPGPAKAQLLLKLADLIRRDAQNAWAMLNPNVPFGGVKESGFGRDMGEEALARWMSVKAVKYHILPRL
ncbi:hypothetical protein NUU61_001266 [Penicillium alfredii]|uniref:aldehyde dehydrogenase (NAD(+)) n=1 Tax=Penicillium alfredii TaxID=1506179 RepID=A0A9W9GC71_9EURO|nr:uncharacterized protein NUU61_001266 [Penicillium alfredii]KAJ5115507.1 hypothetical protein NUU61_001266 [Penicillium alfredii]